MTQLTTHPHIQELLRTVRRIAVVGIKPETHAGQPAHDVPRYMMSQGYTIIPVPVYYPSVTQILGQPVYRKLADAEREAGPIELVNLFRRSEDVPLHLEELLALKPRAVWMQLGIQHDEVAAQLMSAGIDVVMNRCILVDHRAMG